jgi:Toxin co-regulated pilus biosynthesis protein Q
MKNTFFWVVLLLCGCSSSPPSMTMPNNFAARVKINSDDSSQSVDSPTLSTKSEVRNIRAVYVAPPNPTPFSKSLDQVSFPSELKSKKSGPHFLSPEDASRFLIKKSSSIYFKHDETDLDDQGLSEIQKSIDSAALDSAHLFEITAINFGPCPSVSNADALNKRLASVASYVMKNGIAPDFIQASNCVTKPMPIPKKPSTKIKPLERVELNYFVIEEETFLTEIIAKSNYRVTIDDKLFSVAVKRWATSKGLVLVWDCGEDYPIVRNFDFGNDFESALLSVKKKIGGLTYEIDGKYLIFSKVRTQ